MREYFIYILNNVNSFLSQEDKEIIFAISNYDVDDLVDELKGLSSEKIDLIFGDKAPDTNIFDDYELNKKGLQILRCLLVERVFDSNRKKLGLDKHPDYEEYKKNGAIIKEDYFDQETFAQIRQSCLRHLKNTRPSFTGSTPVYIDVSSDEYFQSILKMCLGNNEVIQPTLRLKHVVHDLRDDQHELHIDKLYPNIKIWFYIEDIKHEHGPLHFVLGSHTNSYDKLKWIYDKSLMFSDPKNHVGEYKNYLWSRLAPGLDINAELKKLNMPPESPMTFKKNTLIVVDTAGFHRRGETTENTVRLALRAVLPREQIYKCEI